MKRLELWVIAGAAVLSLVLLLAGGTAVETAGWGLSFHTEGQAPAGPLSVQRLAEYDAVYLGSSEEKVLYLTFDAGYENGHTGAILDVLKQHEVPAAFFLVGNYLQQNPDLVRRMVAEGHIVGNHTMHHPDMSAITDSGTFSRELSELEDLFSEITGSQMPKFYRPPQGLYSEENLKLAKELGYKTVFWSLAYADWDNDNQPSRDAAMEKLLSRAHPGAVVLLHSTSKTNAEILDELLTKWAELGYRFASLEELFSQEMRKNPI